MFDDKSFKSFKYDTKESFFSVVWPLAETLVCVVGVM